MRLREAGKLRRGAIPDTPYLVPKVVDDLDGDAAGLRPGKVPCKATVQVLPILPATRGTLSTFFPPIVHFLSLDWAKTGGTLGTASKAAIKLSMNPNNVKGVSMKVTAGKSFAGKGASGKG